MSVVLGKLRRVVAGMVGLAWGKAVQFGCFLSLGAGNARMVVTVMHSIFPHFRSYMLSSVHSFITNSKTKRHGLKNDRIAANKWRSKPFLGQ